MHQRDADREHLLLPSRERAGKLRAALGEDGKELEHELAPLGEPRALALDEAAQLQVGLDAQRAEHTMTLRHEGDAVGDVARRRAPGDVAAAQQHRARGDLEQAEERARQRGFAGAVVSEQEQDAAGVDLEVHAVHHVLLAVAGDQGPGGERHAHLK